ncbi:MAG: mercuric reductase [Pirellulales bacterium]|nr:mercuric reductase [Pirellulales bacterium]
MAERIAIPPDDESNRALVAHVHPSEWQNPTPAERYNLVVVGAGTAGLVAAAGAAGLGAKVALIERHLMGGDCLNYGCVPSKALLRASRAAAAVRDAREFGIETGAELRIDFSAVMERVRRLRSEISPHDSAARFRELGVDVFLGEGRFTNDETVEVAGQSLRFKRAVIATGARPARPSIPGLEEAGYLTNETVFNLTQLPERLAVIGGGPVGCELAQAFARLGAQVWLVEPHGQLLPRDEPQAAAVLEQALRRDGVHLLLKHQVERLTAEKTLQLTDPQRGTMRVKVDEVLVGAGRVPNVEGLGLDAAGVRYDLRRGVEVNDRLQTTNPRIFAAGDVCSAYRFTHAADAMARVVLQNALFLGRAKTSTLVIPWCTYTDPEVAHVGLLESEAQARGIAVDVFAQPFDRVDRATLDGETEGLARILVERGTDRIVGATIVAAHAGDILSQVTQAMVAGVGLKTIARTIHPYPTQAEALKKIADAYSRTRLTPRVKSLFERWLRWTR